MNNEKDEKIWRGNVELNDHIQKLNNSKKKQIIMYISKLNDYK